MSNKAHRHSKRASNLDTNRAFKRVIIAALRRAEFPNRASRRLVARVAREVSASIEAQAIQVAQS